MSDKPFKPTAEQKRIIGHEGSAFVSACPGAGKTRVLVERARAQLKDKRTGKGVAFLSFTNAAVSELEKRLREERILPSVIFPHFIGTFDSFLWRFLIAPFGVPGCEAPPRLIPDKDEMIVQIAGFWELPLKCFDWNTGELLLEAAQRHGFRDGNPGLTKAYTTAAASLRHRLERRGDLDFSDARAIAARRLEDRTFSSRLAAALAGRFREVIVDEAHDCNPADLGIIQWLLDAGIAAKVICDPQQSIYSFRGGVTEELIAFGEGFEEDNRLSMSGNFRSSDPICRAIVALRPPDAREPHDRALGEHSAVTTPVHILAYPGRRVPATVGAKFRELVQDQGMDVALCPVLAATRHSGASAIGQPSKEGTKDLTLRLAAAVTAFHFAFEMGNRRAALEEVHRVVLAIEDRLGGQTYHQYLATEGLESDAWRPRILKLVLELRYDSSTYPDPEAWHAQAKAILAANLPASGPTIGQRLKRNAKLPTTLAAAPTSNPPAKTIHAVKGMEFPAVCVVMTSSTTAGILEYLESGGPAARAEEARKIYVAASRAQRLLAIATPRSQSARLAAHLGTTNAEVTILNL